MARQFLLLIIFGVSAISSGLAQSTASQQPQPSASPSPSPQAVEKRFKPDHPFNRPPNAGDSAQQFFDRLTPEEKARFEENFERWKVMSPEERQALILREKNRRNKAAQEIEDAIKKSGLQLDKDRREVYALRYTQERRKIEEQLRKDMEEKRKPLVSDMVERLKVEFQPTPSPSPSPAPAASPTPAA